MVMHRASCSLVHDEDEDTDSSNASQQDATPRLIILLRSSNWPMALERMRTHPQESIWRGFDGETALHSAFVDCTKHVPFPIVLGLASGNEDLVSSQMRECTVLDSILLSLCDVLRMPKKIPTYEFRLRFQVIHKLISLDIKVIGEHSLKYLFHLSRIWVDADSFASSSHRASIDSKKNKHGVSQMNFIFALMDLVLYVDEHKHMRKAGDRPYENFLNRLIAARSRFEFPMLVLNLALERFGTIGCTEYDITNRTPLIHVILSAESEKSNRETKVIILRKILEEAPGNASLPYLGNNFPLHLAIRQGYQWESVLEPIVLDCTSALTEIDPATNLYPFLQSAAIGLPLDTIFKLLQTNPNVVSSL
jgi:hypothetical protein